MLAQEYERAALEPVRVQPLRTRRQVRELAGCETILIHRPDVDDRFDAAIDELREWLDLAAFALAANTGSSAHRALCADVLTCVRALERQGVAVLAGRMLAPERGCSHVACLSLAPKRRTSGAARGLVLVDPRRGEPPAPEFA